MYDPDDPKLRPVFDHGFAYLVDHMGEDAAIARAARISYGAGTKSVRQDRGLIRYLLRHKHTSPFEMCVVKFHLRVPIFVMRQLIRHRTASVNEYSARYSVMTDDFYVPEVDAIQPQSTVNNQGRAGSVSEVSAEGVQWMMETTGETAYDVYRVLLGERTGRDADFPNDLIYDPYSDYQPLLDDEFPGIARELARTVLPVSFYTEVYWQQNLWNLFHLLKLRTDSHTQYETRMVAEAMYDLIKPLFPIACEAYEDYLRDAVSLSRMEVNLLTDLLHNKSVADIDPDAYGLSKREFSEFIVRFDLGADINIV